MKANTCSTFSLKGIIMPLVELAGHLQSLGLAPDEAPYLWETWVQRQRTGPVLLCRGVAWHQQLTIFPWFTYTWLKIAYTTQVIFFFFFFLSLAESLPLNLSLFPYYIVFSVSIYFSHMFSYLILWPSFHFIFLLDVFFFFFLNTLFHRSY